MTKPSKKSARITREEALKRHYKRPPHARSRDECEINKHVNKEPTKAWEKSPNKSDVLGIDVPTLIDEHGNMRVSRVKPKFCFTLEDKEKIAKAIKGKKINPIYDPKYDIEAE